MTARAYGAETAAILREQARDRRRAPRAWALYEAVEEALWGPQHVRYGSALQSRLGSAATFLCWPKEWPSREVYMQNEDNILKLLWDVELDREKALVA